MTLVHGVTIFSEKDEFSDNNTEFDELSTSIDHVLITSWRVDHVPLDMEENIYSRFPGLKDLNTLPKIVCESQYRVSENIIDNIWGF